MPVPVKLASFTGTGIFAGSDGSGYGNSVLFQETTTVSNPQASSVKVSAAITNMDHSGRADVLRYDTPTFMGLKGMMSYRPSQGDVDLQL